MVGCCRAGGCLTKSRGEGSQGVDEGNVVDILAGLPTDRLLLYDDS